MISVCSIVYNEEKLIPKFVNQVKDFADEIVIVDNNSTDNSFEIAQSLGCTVIKNNNNSFDLGRNLYIQKARENWILSLDLDEIIMPSTAINLKKYLQNITEESLCGIYLPAFQYYGEGKWATFYICRLYKNFKGYKYNKDIHGSVASSIISKGGNFSFFYAPIHHFDSYISPERNYSKRLRNIGLLTPKKDISSFCFLALEYFAIGSVDKAFDLLEQAIQYDKYRKSPARLFYSQMLCKLGDYKNAIYYAQSQSEICNKKIINNDKKSCLYKNMIDSCNLVIINSLIGLSKEKTYITELINKQIDNNKFLPHNYLNLYLLDPKTNIDCLYKSIQLNPMILDKSIYYKTQGPNIYSVQSSILHKYDLSFLYNIEKENNVFKNVHKKLDGNQFNLHNRF